MLGIVVWVKNRLVINSNMSLLVVFGRNFCCSESARGVNRRGLGGGPTLHQLITAGAANLFGIFNIVESVRLLMNISWYAHQYQVRLHAVKWDVGGSRNATHWICNRSFLFSFNSVVYFLHSECLRINAYKI